VKGVEHMLGSDVPTAGGLLNAFKWAELWDCDCFQIYVTPGRAWTVPELDPMLARAFQDAVSQNRTEAVVAHVPYLVNLASPDHVLREKSKTRLVAELRRCDALGVQYAVLHPGSSKGMSKDVSLGLAAESLSEVFGALGQESRVKLCLETMSGQGSMLGSSLEELREMLDHASDPRLGICIDLAHVFQAGYDIRGVKGYSDFIGRVEYMIGLDRVGVIHCNDSATGLGSRSDRHSYPGSGFVGTATFWSLLRDGRFASTPNIVELPDKSAAPRAIQELRALALLVDAPGADEHRVQNQLKFWA
jgi:deoxyribonuclease IV